MSTSTNSGDLCSLCDTYSLNKLYFIRMYVHASMTVEFFLYTNVCTWGCGGQYIRMAKSEHTYVGVAV